MRTYLRILSVAACLGIACGLLQANLITNNSFETPTVPVGGFTNFPGGSTAITGWTAVGPQASIVSNTYTAARIVFNAEDGVQWQDLTGDSSNAVEGVEQTVATTPGTNYVLSFWVGNVFNPGGAFGTTSTVNVRLGGIAGTLLGSFTNNNQPSGTQDWKQFTTSFTAAGTSTIIDFLNGDPGNDNSNGLDNVDLEVGPAAVPEPGTMALLMAGILGFGLLRQRRTS